jgi:hypothetical protein
MEMHILPQRDVFAVLEKRKLSVLEVLFIDLIGGNFVSCTFFAKKNLEPHAASAKA